MLTALKCYSITDVNNIKYFTLYCQVLQTCFTQYNLVLQNSQNKYNDVLSSIAIFYRSVLLQISQCSRPVYPVLPCVAGLTKYIHCRQYCPVLQPWFIPCHKMFKCFTQYLPVYSIKNVLHSVYCYRHFNVLSSVLCYKPHNVLNSIALGYRPHSVSPSIGLTYRPDNVLQNVYPVLPCVSDNRYKCKISYLTCCNKLNQTKLLQPEHQTRL